MDLYGIPYPTLTHCQSLVFIIGLDPSNNSSHASIWEALSKQPRSADQNPLQYKIVTSDQLAQLPPMKQKRQSYEWYTPKGVLKRNWMGKYLNEVPSLVTVFHTLDWADPAWQENKMQLVNTILGIKASLGGRSTRVAAVLLQTSTSPATADDSTPHTPATDDAGLYSSERAASVCTACELPPKHLFVMPLSDPAHLQGYTARLDAALSDISGAFYLALSKSVRAHRDFLNKNNHQLLFVRHNFKIGFLLEMKNDMQGAIKAYLQSYQHLSELRYTDTNLQELRVAAAIVNYKVCRVNFLLNLPRDSIAHFRRHIDLFRSRMGPKPLLFEHYAWLAAQYEVFGSLFEGAVLQGLPAVQTQHPGFYYQQAAQFAALRRNTAVHLCSAATATHNSLLDGWDNLEIFGQRPWRAGKHSLEPPENERELAGTEAIQYREFTDVQHSEIIIPLYSRAVAQFQRYKCSRIKQQLMVQVATEYHKAEKDAKALSVLKHVVWQYRCERWWSLVSACSSLMLHCAYATADVPAYIAIAMEITGPRVSLPHDTKLKVYRDGLMKLLQGAPPSPLPPACAAPAVVGAWQAALQQAKSTSVEVDLSVVAPCVEVRATFPCRGVPAYSDTPVTLHLRNNFTEPIFVSKLQVKISCQPTPHQKSPSLPTKQEEHQQSSSEPSASVVAPPLMPDVTLESVTTGSLVLPPGTVQKVVLPFVPEPLPQDAKNLKIVGVSCSLSAGDSGTITLARLNWGGPGTDGVTQYTANAPGYKEFNLLCSDEFDTLSVISELAVHHREPLIDVQVSYDSAALVWEWLEVRVALTNKEQGDVTQLSLALGLQQPAQPQLEQTTQVCSSSGCSSSEASSCSVRDVQLMELQPGRTTHQTLYVKSLTAATRQLTLQVRYNTPLEVGGRTVQCPCECSRDVTVKATIPFKVDVSCESNKFEGITQVCAGQDFLVVPRIVCSSHVPITLTQSKLLLSASAACVCSGSGCVSGCSLTGGETADDCFSVRVHSNTPPAQHLPLGHYLLHWNRSDSGAPAVSMSVALPSVGVEVCGVSVEAHLPPFASLYCPTPITYTLTNTSLYSVECVVTMEPSQNFMFTGNQQVRLRVLSSQHCSVDYVLYPTACGSVALPRLSVTLDIKPGQPLQHPILPRLLPSHLLVKPQHKPGSGATVSSDVAPGSGATTSFDVAPV